MLIMRRSEQHAFCAAHNSALCSFADHRLWLGRQHQAFTEATNDGGLERPAQCGEKAGWAIAEPGLAPCKRQRRVTKPEQGHRAGCGVYGASGGGEFQHGIARYGAASPWPRRLGLRAQWRSAGGNGGYSVERSHVASLPELAEAVWRTRILARPSPARRLPRSMQAA